MFIPEEMPIKGVLTDMDIWNIIEVGINRHGSDICYGVSG
jgi:hypothetical protein